MMQISVIIPIYNAEKTIARCVQGLQAQTLKPSEIIFVDNGSSDETVPLLQTLIEGWGCNVQICFESSKGAASARNAGVNIAKGDWLVFTDSDCVPDIDWLEKGVTNIAEQQCFALAGPAWGTMEGDLSAKLLSLTTLSVGGEAQWQKQVGDTGVNGFASANLWVSRQAYEQVGGFDVSLKVSGEDYDLCARLFQAGYTIYYSPLLCVRHIHLSGFVTLLAKAMAYGSAHGLLFKKYGRKGIYLDVLGGQRLRFLFPVKIWGNIVSAEKKMIFLLVLAMFWPVCWLFLFLYPAFISRFLYKRAKALKQPLSFSQAYIMGWLLVFRSLAFTVGRMKGSRWGVWLF